MRLLEALRNSVAKLEGALADSKLFDHMGDRGEFRERVIADFLRPFLPKCYGLGSGAAFSADGSGSRQLDVVIYDDVFSNVLFRDRDNSLFPCESVFGVIEVKSDLDSGELAKAIDNIRSLHSLPRQPSDMMDLFPLCRLNVGGGLTHDKQQRNRYLGIVFAYDGLTSDSVLKVLNDPTRSASEKLQLPDFVFNYKRGYMLLRWLVQNGRPTQPAPCRPFDQFVAIKCGTDTLPLFFLSVNTCLNQLRLRAPDLNAYWMSVTSECMKAKVADTTKAANSGGTEQT